MSQRNLFARNQFLYNSLFGLRRAVLSENAIFPASLSYIPEYPVIHGLTGRETARTVLQSNQPTISITYIILCHAFHVNKKQQL